MTTVEDVQQAGLMRALELQREEMARELERTRALNDELEQRVSSGEAEQGSIETAIAEFSKGKTGHVQGGAMQTPCQHQYADGRTCGKSWGDHLAQGSGNLNRDAKRAKVTGHSYRQSPLQRSEKPKGSYFLRTAADDLYPVEDEQPKALPDLYVDEKTAAQMLGATVPQVRKMVRDQSLKADRIGSVTLIHRSSVDLKVEMKAALAAEGVTA